jgi:hypothetical protein
MILKINEKKLLYGLNNKCCSDGERCDESGRVMNLLSQAGGKRHTSDFQQSKNVMTTVTPSSSISVLSDRNKWWNR